MKLVFDVFEHSPSCPLHRDPQRFLGNLHDEWLDQPRESHRDITCEHDHLILRGPPPSCPSNALRLHLPQNRILRPNREFLPFSVTHRDLPLGQLEPRSCRCGSGETNRSSRSQHVRHPASRSQNFSLRIAESPEGPSAGPRFSQWD